MCVWVGGCGWVAVLVSIFREETKSSRVIFQTLSLESLGITSLGKVVLI